MVAPSCDSNAPRCTTRVLQVRFHDDIDGSSLARAIYASQRDLYAPRCTTKVLQVRFHDDIDGSSLARAIYASTGPLQKIL